ncbi:DnaJ-like protein [Tilletia horrida]|nr:DnaJ-like protein [Tilletia horrida]
MSADAPPAAAAAPAAESAASNINRDGFKVADMEFYNLLGVSANATDLELKKAYRKAAIRNHPDKGGDEETFKMVGEAYRVLSDNNLRADYDKHGKKKPAEEVGIKEATEMFGNMFGGERFVHIIGEISLMKDMTKTSEIIMTEEEKAEFEKSMRAESAAANGDEAAAQQTVEGEKPAETATPAGGTAATTAGGATSGAADASTDASKPSVAAAASRNKLTPEQKQKLEQFEKEKEAEKEKRIHDLSEQLKDRIRPYVDARNPGDKDDSETQVWVKRMSEEAEDLKFESFGVELLHTIGGIYIARSTTWIKSRRHNFLGVPGFFSKLKERGSQVKETWGLLGSAVSVQISMEELAKRQEKGDIGEEELKQLEADMSGKMLLVTWRGTRFEVNNVLRKVCDNLLNEPGVDKHVLLRRAQALTLLGAIYTKVQPDPDQTERRELEELVASAANKRKKSKQQKQHDAAAAASPSAASPAATPGAGATQ